MRKNLLLIIFGLIAVSALGIQTVKSWTPAAAPSAIPEIRYSPRAEAVAGAARPEISLNGTWRFNPAGDVSAGWTKIQVPGDWTMQGFAVTPGKAAAYATDIEIPADWKGLRIKLRCDGVQSDACLSVNGRPAGAHQGGFTAFELDITPFIRTGRTNTIALAVTNESLADELASGTQYAAYQFGGITRKIYLQALPATNLAALRITTDLDEDCPNARLKAEIEVANEGGEINENLRAVFTLADGAGRDIPLDRIELKVPPLGPGKKFRHTGLETLPMTCPHVPSECKDMIGGYHAILLENAVPLAFPPSESEIGSG